MRWHPFHNSVWATAKPFVYELKTGRTTMSEKEKRPNDRDLLLGALALQNDLANEQQLIRASQQAQNDTDRSFTDVLYRVAGLDEKSMAALQHLADAKVAKQGGDTNGTLMKTIDSVPQAKNFLANFGPLQESELASSTASQETVSGELPVSDRYDLQTVHGRGGLGQIWRAHDRFMSREVAVKEILPSAAEIPEVTSRFMREAKITGQLEHPGIVPVYDVGRLPDEDQPFYAMRFIEGETLDDRIRKYHQIEKRSEESSLQLRELLAAFVGICNAVAYAHHKRVLHRDLKPQNIILGKFGEVSVLDWGLARLMDSDDEEEKNQSVVDHQQMEKTAAGAVMGTPAFMSPEQAQGNQAELGEQTDVYALGAILYQILTGEPPFVARKYEDLVQQICEQAPTPPREEDTTIAAPLSAICLKAIEKKPADRYQSAADLAEDINRYLADEKVLAYQESTIELARRWMRRHRTLVTSAAATMVVAIIGLTTTAILLNSARNREVIAKQKIASQKSAIELANESLGRVNADLETTNGQLEKANNDLVTANQKVERSLKDARDAIDQWYTLVAENKELKTSPRSSAFRQQLLRRAGDYYEKFLSELPESETLQLSAAQSQLRLAIIKLELQPGLAALPYFEKAEKTYVSLVKNNPEDRDLKMALAGVLNDKSAAYYQVNQFQTALDSLGEVEKIYGQLIRESAEDRQLQRKMATVVSNRAEIYLKLNKLSECIKSFSAAIDVYQQLIEADFETMISTRELGKCYYRRAAAHLKQQSVAAALQDFIASKKIREELLELDPNDPGFRADMLSMSFDYGNLLLQTSKYAEAEKTFGDAVKLAEGLSADYPDVPDYYFSLANAHGNLARSQSIQKKLDPCLKSFGKALEVSSELVKQHPDVPTYLAQKANLAINFGIALAQIGKTDDAIKQFQNATETYVDLTKRFPDMQSYARVLLNTRSNLAAMYLRKNDLKKSDEITTELIADAQRFVKRWPNAPDLKMSLAAVYSNRAATRSQTEKRDQAKSDFDAALKIREQLSTEYPDNLEYLRDLAESYNNYGIYLTYIRNTDAARKLLEKAVATRKQIAQKNKIFVGAATDVAVSTFALGQSYMHDQPEKAEQIFSDSIVQLTACIKRAPRFNRAQKYLMLSAQSRAWVRMYQKKYKQAIADLEQLLHIETPRIKHETRASLAYLYAKAGQREKSNETLDQCRLNLVIATQSQLDYAATFALRHAAVLGDDSIAAEEREKQAAKYLKRCIAGLKIALANPDITSHATWASIAKSEDFQSVVGTEEFKQLAEKK